ncbi:MAG: hypothetical protein ACREEP_14890 [Dongiaceae bacterium]
MREGTHAFVQFEETQRRERLHGLAWSVPRTVLIDTVKQIDSRPNVEIHPVRRNQRRRANRLYAHIRY